MSDKVLTTLREKTKSILAEGVGSHAVDALRLGIDQHLRTAIARAYPELSEEAAFDLAFHLSDWREDGAFLTALALAPTRFTPEEIEAGITGFLVHAPNHIAAAAKISGWQVEDIFGLGVLGETPESRDEAS